MSEIKRLWDSLKLNAKIVITALTPVLIILFLALCAMVISFFADRTNTVSKNILREIISNQSNIMESVNELHGKVDRMKGYLESNVLEF